MAQLTCKNLTLGYDNRAIQEDLNFSIDAGDYLCIVGENGSGKSTLMKTLLHLQAPISGSIELGDGLKKNEIGYLPQQTLVQRDFPASVREIVLSGCQSRCGWRPFYNKEEKMVAQRAMEKMMIQDLADQCYRELSGGQQQRVLLARALCAAQKILLLDEPVSGLDPRVTAEMYQLIRNLSKICNTYPAYRGALLLRNKETVSGKQSGKGVYWTGRRGRIRCLRHFVCIFNTRLCVMH